MRNVELFIADLIDLRANIFRNANVDDIPVSDVIDILFKLSVLHVDIYV